jgi:hypothetical protein
MEYNLEEAYAVEYKIEENAVISLSIALGFICWSLLQMW